MGSWENKKRISAKNMDFTPFKKIVGLDGAKLYTIVEQPGAYAFLTAFL